MKRIILALLSLGILNSCTEEVDSNFHIEGNVKGMRKGMVYLKKEVHGTLELVDSVFLKGTDAFEFSGNIESPEVYYLSTSRRNSATLPVFVEKKNITVTAEVKDLLAANIEGSENQDLLDQFNKIIGRYNIRRNELYIEGLQANNRKHFKTLSSISTKYERNEKRRSMYILNFAVTNAMHDVSPYIALNYLSSSDINVLDTINNSMSPEVQNGIYGSELKELVTQIKATSVGNKFPELVQKDTSNADIKLENPNGYLFLRFWASNDNVSRSSNNFVKKMYEEFDEEDLKIISISIDTDKKDWLAAIKEDNLPWLQVTDLLGSDNEAVRKLAIRVLPESILVDNEGTIVGRNLYINEIEDIVREYVKNKPVVEETTEEIETEKEEK